MKHWSELTLGEVAQATGQKVAQGRDWLKAHSPVWLNLEVNPELIKKVWFAIAPALQYALGKVGEGIQFLLPSEDDELLLPGQETRLLPPVLEQPKHKPHWQRTSKVFAALDQAWQLATNWTYSTLIDQVRLITGKGCSRRVISRWKKERGLV